MCIRDRDPEVLSEVAGAPLLGVTLFEAAAKTKPLVMVEAPRSPLAEAYRTLRTNLSYVDIDHDRKSIVITSAVSGETKTTTSCNLAIALAQSGARVLLVEADLRRPMAATSLGMENAVGLTTVLTGQVDLDSAVQSWGGGLFDFLGSGALPPNPTELLGSRQMGELIAVMSERYDMVIFDAAPTLPVADAAVLAAQFQGAVYVARHGRVTVDQVRHAMDNMARVSANVLGVVLTLAPKTKRGQGYGYYQYGYESQASLATVAPLPSPVQAPTHLRVVRESSSAPVDPTSPLRIPPQTPTRVEAPPIADTASGEAWAPPTPVSELSGVAEVVVTRGRRAVRRDGA